MVSQSGAWPSSKHSRCVRAKSPSPENQHNEPRHEVSRPAAGKSSFISLEHVPKKLLDFFDKDMLQLFEFKLLLFDHVIPRDREAL
jgi:hypothetical protein